jgi:hypothetical protein
MMSSICDIGDVRFALHRSALKEQVVSYEEKGMWVYLVTTLGSYGVYLAVILGRAGGAPLAQVSYVAPMLWTIGISIIASMVGRIAVETARPSDRHQRDARDRDIRRFGEYVGAFVLAVAMAVPFGLALVNADQFWIANAMYAAFVVWAVASTSVKLVAYRRGL